MIKSFSGTSITYGPNLPSPASTIDGTLFFKTAPDADGISNPPQLFIFNFQQDISAGILGEQVGDMAENIIYMTSLAFIKKFW